MTKRTDPPKGITRIRDDEWREANDGPKPADLRDQIEGPADWLRPQIVPDDPLMDVRPDGGLDRPLPDRQGGHAAVPPGQASQVTRDSSLSREAEIRAAGGDALGVYGMSD